MEYIKNLVQLEKEMNSKETDVWYKLDLLAEYSKKHYVSHDEYCRLEGLAKLSSGWYQM